jgi:hypothetical protein
MEVVLLGLLLLLAFLAIAFDRPVAEDTISSDINDEEGEGSRNG